MKKQVLLRWLWCTLEYLMFFPVVLIIAGIILPFKTAVIFSLTLPVHLLFALVLTSSSGKLKNLFAVLAGILYVIIISFIFRTALLTDGNGGQVITIAAGIAAFYIWGIKEGIGESTNTFFLFSGGLFLHIVVLFIISQVEILKPYFTLAMWVSIIYCIAGLPLTNRHFLISETNEKDSLKIIPGSVLRRNKIIVSIMLIFIIILSFWRALLDTFLFIAESIAWAIKKVFEFLGSLYQPAEDSAPGLVPGDMEMLPAAGGENTVLSTILDIIAVAIFVAILVLVVIYIIKNYKRIYQALYNLLSSFFNRFQKWSSTEHEYFDREESLLKTEIQKRQPLLKRLFKREPKWKDMKDNESRIRFIYTEFVVEHIKKGLRFKISDTPAEVVKSAGELDNEDEKDHTMLKNAYNSVRYGAKPIDDETVSILKDRYL